MAKKGENIYKRKDGRWEGRYIRSRKGSGKAEYGYIYGKTYGEVKQKLVRLKGLPQQCFEESGKKSIAYSRLLDYWLRFSRLNVKESTYSRYVHLVETHIKPHLGDIQLSHLTSQIIEDYVESELKNGRLDGRGGLAPKTVIDILTVIKSSIEYARYSNYHVSCNLKRLSVKKKEREMRVLTQAEQAALLKILTTEMDLYKFGVLLSLYTGIRIGELCALTWENLCLSESVLRVRKTMQRIQETEKDGIHKTKIIITEPKSRCSVREIPLPPFIVEMARPFFASPQSFVLTGDTERFVEPRTMQNRFKTYALESGIKKANFHATRHTFATRCVELGFEIKSLSEILGHANVNITLNRYVHSSFELKCANMNKLTLDL